jgi:hypothetical protein
MLSVRGVLHLRTKSKLPMILASLMVVALLATVIPADTASAVGSAPLPGFNSAGNILIADQYNNRVIELVPNQHSGGLVVWRFGNGSNVAGPNSVVGVNDVERISDGRTLIAGTGVPPNSGIPGFPVGGAPDNRVMIVNRFGEIIWQYGKAGVTGSGRNQLNTPVQATYLPTGNILITDQGNARVIEVSPSKEIVWQYGMTGVPGSGFNQLNNPNSAELLANGHILIADESNNRVIEVARNKSIVWQYGDPSDTSILNGAAFASRLPNGNTLITDAGNNRILEVTKAKAVFWSYVTNTRPGSVADPLPTRAVRLLNGQTLISDQFNQQVISVDMAGHIVWKRGKIGVPGTGTGLLNGPYDAKVIGDYTGLTSPF